MPLVVSAKRLDRDAVHASCADLQTLKVEVASQALLTLVEVQFRKPVIGNDAVAGTDEQQASARRITVSVDGLACHSITSITRGSRAGSFLGARLSTQPTSVTEFVSTSVITRWHNTDRSRVAIVS